jgi:hypothetical protein
MSDGRLRTLARKAVNDPSLSQALATERARAGLCVKHPDGKMTGVKRRTCSECRAERKQELARERALRELVLRVYEPRRDRTAHPDGSFDSGGRWFPTEAEDAGDVAGEVRSPSRRWPYSYMIRARSRKHCQVLVERGLAGELVPLDVAMVLRAASAETRSLFPPAPAQAVRGGKAHASWGQDTTALCGRPLYRRSSPAAEVSCKACLRALG